MAEAVVSGSSENGGSPKTPSPCVGKDVQETAGGPASASPSATASHSVSLDHKAEATLPSGGSSPIASTVDENSEVASQGRPSQDAPPVLSGARDEDAPRSSGETAEVLGERDETEKDETAVSDSGVEADATPSSIAHLTTTITSSASSAGLAEATCPATAREDSVPGEADGGVGTGGPEGAPAVTPVALDLPCMRAQLVVTPEGAHVMAGLWGMTPAAHEQPGHTSPFELKLAAPRPGLPPHPPRASGHYSGFFMLQQPGGKAPLKVDEKSVHLTFIANVEGGHNVQGTGKNRFGQFTVTGSIDAGGRAELFRAYVPKPTGTQTAGAAGRKRANSVATTGPKKSAGLTIDPSVISSGQMPAPNGSTSPGSPRGSGKSIQSLATTSSSALETVTPRSKRTTAGDWKDKADIPMNREHREPAAEPRAKATTTSSGAHPERKGKGKEHAQAISGSSGRDSPVSLGSVSDVNGGSTRIAGVGVELPSSLGGRGESKAGRVRKLPAHLQDAPQVRVQARLNEHMRKCLSVLRELQRHPSGSWFAAPVDWKLLNLPDYPAVVKRPMDFGTLKTLVETGEVSTPEAFRDLVLLVFRNATSYNTRKDNVVHVAAVELRSLFEDRFRQQVESLGTSKEPERDDGKALGAVGVGRSRKAGAGNGGRGAASSTPKNRPGPRAGAAAPSVSGGGCGGGAMIPEAQYMQLQQQMELMQAQLHELRRQTSQTEVSMAVQLQAREAQRDREILSFGAVAAAGASVGSGSGGGRGRGGDDSRPLTEAEKEALKAGISKLAPEKVHRVVEIIKERSPSLGDDDDEIEVDLDTLDAPTLHHLQRYVKSCAPRKRKKATSSSGQMGLLQHPSPGLPDELDMDVNALEEDALLFGESKRGRSGDMDGLDFSQSDMPDEV